MRSDITRIPAGKAQAIYYEILDAIAPYGRAADFIDTAWRIYQQNYPSNPSINGRIFEFLLIETLVRAGIAPIYYQARFEQVPNCDFDIVLYHPRRPVALSAKVSLRERYKQAALEGLALQQVYRQAQQHLITLSASEAAANTDKITSGDIAGLNSIVVANRPEYDALITDLKDMECVIAKPVRPIHGEVFP